MKSFFQKIWSFVLWLISPIVIVFRGRKVVSLPEDEDGNHVRSTDLACLNLLSWLGKVEKVFLHAKYVTFGKTRKQVLKISIHLPGLLADHYFRDLCVIIFRPGQSSGVTYEADTDDIRVYANHLHSMTIEPTSAVSALLLMKKLDEEDAYPTGVERIRLELDGESRDFLCNEKSDFFYPATANAAGF